MKIHSLLISNIASLKGEHFVDFENIFQQSNLFAITGKTGAGKSTLLNCISLALYGEIYKKESHSEDFITLGEMEGHIELLFSVSIQKYRAKWNMRLRKKNGEILKKPQLRRELYLVNNTKEIAIDKKIEDIIHLNFNQFCKTTILNQGEFARFLTSKFSERKDILEKFYEGENLDQLNILLNQKIKKKTHSLEETHNIIKGLEESFLDIKITQKDILLLKQQDKSYQQVLTHFSAIKENIKDIEKFLKSLKEADTRLTLLKEKREEINNHLNITKKNATSLKDKLQDIKNQLEIKKPIFNQAISYLNQKDNLQNQILTYNHKKKSLQEINHSKQETLQKITIQINALDGKKNDLLKQYSFLEKCSPNKLKIELNEIQNTAKNHEILSENLISIKTKLSEQKNIFNELKNEHLALKKQLESISEDEIFKNIQVYQSDKSQLNDLLQLFLTKSKMIYQAQTQLKEYKDQEHFHKTQLIELQRQLEVLQKQKNQTLKIKELKKYNFALTICLEESLKNHQCCVCGNKNIDLKQKQDKSEEDDLAMMEKELQVNQQNIAKSQAELNSHQDQIKRLIEIMHNTLEAIANDEALLHKAWNQNKWLKNFSFQNNDNSIDIVKEQIDQLEKNIESDLHKQQMLRIKNEKFSFKQEEIKKHEQQIQVLNEDLTTLQKRIDLDEKVCEDFCHKYNFTYFSSTFFNDLKNIFFDIEKYFELCNQKEKDEMRYKNEQEHIYNTQKELEFITQEHEALYTNLKKIEVYLEQNKITFNPKLELSKLEEQYSQCQKDYLKELETLKECEIKNAEIISKIENNKHHRDESILFINKTQKNIEPLSILFKNELHPIHYEKLNHLCLKFKQLKTQDIDENIFRISHTQFNELYETMLSEYNSLKTNFTTQTTLFQKKKESEDKILDLQKDINKTQNEAQKLYDLHLLIGKDEFRNFVLAMLENMLISQTNTELKQLCQARYQIIQTNKNNKMASEFKIIDNFCDGKMRKVSTLSGGETFLVSLAMALALAELTKGQTQIDSLFIDEGFGTLDTESIDEVLNLLMSIQSSGKQVGIISHIKELTSRIPVNIQLNKTFDGSSNISILLN